MEMRGDYAGVSVNYLVEAGALNNTNAPIGGDDWSVTATTDGGAFSINLTQLSEGECQYFTATPPKWAERILVNNVELTSQTNNCFSTSINQISFIVK